jgi:hypothetical protein
MKRMSGAIVALCWKCDSATELTSLAKARPAMPADPVLLGELDLAQVAHQV